MVFNQRKNRFFTSDAAQLLRDAQPDDTKRVAAIVLVGFIVRLSWVLWGSWTSGDSPQYVQLARNLVFNHVYSLQEGTGALAPSAYRPPLYSALIAFFWWGETAPLNAVLFFQVVLGTATVALVYLIARRHFNRTVALIAALAMALAPMSIRFTGVILTETFFTFLLTLGIALWGERRPAWTGVVFGLAALTRATILPFLIALPLLALLPAWRPYWRRFVLITLMALLVSSVWIARNAVVFGKFIPIAASGWGAGMLAGSIETKFVGDDVFTALLSDPAFKIDGPITDETETDRLMMRRAIKRIKDNPLHWLVVRAKQYPRLFMDSGDYLLGSHNVTFGQALREPRPLVVLVKVAFMLGNLLFVLLVAYGLYVERRRFVELSHLWLFPLFLLLAQLPFWIEARYSLPIVPVMVIFAAVGVARLVGDDARPDELKAQRA